MIVLIYVLPLVVMLLTYSVIGLKLWRREVPKHQMHGAGLRHLRAKRKVRAGGGARRRGGGVSSGPASGHRPSGARPSGGTGEHGIHPNFPQCKAPPEPEFFPGGHTLALGQMRNGRNSPRMFGES